MGATCWWYEEHTFDVDDLGAGEVSRAPLGQGDTVPVIVDRLTGEVRQAQIFVAFMRASSFSYVAATWTQTLGDWIGAHTRALAAIGGVPPLIVPDNAKVAVIKACLYEP